jgi:hypothetical protein
VTGVPAAAGTDSGKGTGMTSGGGPTASAPHHLAILEALEAGEMDVDQAILAIETTHRRDEAAQQPKTPTAWFVLLGSGVAITASGGYLGSLGTWWWLLAVPLLLVGALLLVLALSSYGAPWLSIDVEPAAGGGRRIAFSLPLPPRLTARVMRLVQPLGPGWGRTWVEEWLMAIDSEISPAQPLAADVTVEMGGKRVRARWG